MNTIIRQVSDDISRTIQKLRLSTNKIVVNQISNELPCNVGSRVSAVIIEQISSMLEEAEFDMIVGSEIK